MRGRRFLLALAVLALARAAGAIELDLPVACEPGRTCWVVNYADMDTGPLVRDPGCGQRSYDGHDGTDIAIASLAAMSAGVAVRAAAAGVVAAARDGVADTDVNLGGRQAVKGRECGNGVVLDHGQGWQTQYCHMRKGSIAAKPGQRVEAGAQLGLVGLSGLTEFPHLHLTVRRNGVALDPFTGAALGSACGEGPGSLWRDGGGALGYEPFAIMGAGIAGAEPSYAARKAGTAEPAPAAASPLLAIWVDMLGTAPGDVVRLRLSAPDGSAVVVSERVLDRRRARQFLYAGRKREGAAPWPRGTWQGEVSVERAGTSRVMRVETTIP